jgi:hypothetical protein
MGFKEFVVFDILIESPGDVRGARDVVERECHNWTSSRGDQEKVSLRPRRYEMDGVPLITGKDPQAIINEQMVESADIVFALFHARLGTSTPRAIAGTVEELTLAVAAGKPVHTFFSTQRYPHDVDVDQVRALREFKHNLSHVGLIADYTSLGDLQSKVRRALDYDVAHLMRPA